MRIIKKKVLSDFYHKHNNAKIALEEWYAKTKKAEWQSFSDIKKTFNSVDSIGNQHYVFNIKGNKYRLVVVIKISIKTIFIRFVGTHADYDKIDAKNI